jgi:hypothetical protein
MSEIYAEGLRREGARGSNWESVVRGRRARKRKSVPRGGKIVFLGSLLSSSADRDELVPMQRGSEASRVRYCARWRRRVRLMSAGMSEVADWYGQGQAGERKWKMGFFFFSIEKGCHMEKGGAKMSGILRGSTAVEWSTSGQLEVGAGWCK